MDQVRSGIAESRENTDASLGAERASMDATTELTSATAQHVLAGLIDRERIIVDDRLLKFREHADSTIARKRSESATPDGSVAYERQVADDGKKIEREFTDALLVRERRRADAVVETEIQKHDAHVAPQEARRHDSDDQLS